MSEFHPDERHSDYAMMQMKRKASRIAMWALFAVAAALLVFLIYAGIAGSRQNWLLLPLVLFPIFWALRLMTDINRSERAEARMRANDRAGRHDGPANRLVLFLPIGVMVALAIWTVDADVIFNIGDYGAADFGALAIVVLPIIVLGIFLVMSPRRTDRPKGTLEQELIWAEQAKRSTMIMWLSVAVFGVVIIGAAIILPSYLMGPPAPYLR